MAKEPRAKTSKPKEGQHDDLIEGVRALGMTSANATQVAEAGGDRSPSIIRPPDKALIAWRLRDLIGITNQTEIANEMIRKGHPATQGQVSRWLTHVEKYLSGGNVLPDISVEGLKQKPQAIDPPVIEMGPRQDGRTPRQRQRRSEDSDD